MLEVALNKVVQELEKKLEKKAGDEKKKQRWRLCIGGYVVIRRTNPVMSLEIPAVKTLGSGMFDMALNATEPSCSAHALFLAKKQRGMPKL